MSTFDEHRKTLTQEYREIPSVKTIGTHEEVMARHTEQWVDAMLQEIERLQNQIAILKRELGD